ncbi:hypothetical protein SAMN05216475_1147 [Pseudomonas synxantha]|uniref:Phage protein n=1 Tax=Pseudomonas synxantha TaxID=47883 RepID=A0AAX3I3Q6_9PSED|nr:hypothetical protein [Pseudomonas synxantha]KRP50704.1 hypothetical protein TU77_23025 [Pseudomonas synxantha]SDU12139.1 hypothetical protein SAMN05216475_1147 [Pseudomonas synxantha]VTQ95788.1 Uncharacterised protein [Pseudomonas synxantha]
MNTITMTEIKELARQTGNTPMAVLTDLIDRGYQLVEDAPIPKGTPLTSSKDALAQWKATKQQVADDMYKSDPLVRQLIDADNAYQTFAPQAKKSVLQRDEQGNITGTSKSMLTGATQREQAELMAAIRATYNQGGN